MVGEGLVTSNKFFFQICKVTFTFLCLLRFNRGWDFTPGAGLIVAGSSKPHSKDVERSTDRGQTFTSLPNLPYGQNQGHAMVCVAIIDDNTVFIAGGLFCKINSKLFKTVTTLTKLTQIKLDVNHCLLIPMMIPTSWTSAPHHLSIPLDQKCKYPARVTLAIMSRPPMKL